MPQSHSSVRSPPSAGASMRPSPELDREPTPAADPQAERPPIRVEPRLKRQLLRRQPLDEQHVLGTLALGRRGRHLQRVAGALAQVEEGERRAHLEAVAGAERSHLHSPRKACARARS